MSQDPDPATGPNPAPESPPLRRRRVRYSGTHPRRFAEKYKEQAPEHYADAVAKIIASGKTPAGSHRSIMVAEILETLEPRPGHTVVDCTLGYGGHAREILARLGSEGRLVGFDCDPVELPKTVERLRRAGWDEARFIPVRSNFAGLAAGLAQLGIPGADGILADLGVSSMQIDDPARGFTYKDDGPLDLRMNPHKGLSAAAWLARATPRQLATALADKAEGDARIRRCFQALRIEVNDEFGVLEALLRQLPGCLNPGGRVAILTFHSGEDRRVKRAFAEGLHQGIYEAVTDTVRRPGAEELRSNPRSASAKLRWAIRSGSGNPVATRAPDANR